MKDFEILSHTADLKIRAYGKTMHDLFMHALQGMFQSIHPVTTESTCHYQHDRLVCSKFSAERTITISSSEYSLLLVDFLSEALYLSDVHNEAYLAVTFEQLEPTMLKGIVHGISVERFAFEIKAVTFHDLAIKKDNTLLYVDIVFDI